MFYIRSGIVIAVFNVGWIEITSVFSTGRGLEVTAFSDGWM